MKNSDIVIYTISNSVRDKLSLDLSTALMSGFNRKDERYAEIVLRSGVPTNLLCERIFESTRPFAVLKNLPTDALPDDWNVGSAELTDAVLIGITHAIGLRHFGYPEEKKGAILQDVHPIAGLEKTLSNAGRVKFNLHVESPFLPRRARPEAAALLALNNEAGAATRIAVVDEVNKLLPAEIISILRRPLFTYKHDDSFALNGYTLHTPPSPFLKLLDGYEESRCAIYTIAEDHEAEKAVSAWVEAAESVAVDIILEPGDLLVFNNYRCVHGRGTVEGRRWLKRVYGSRRCDLADANDMVSVWDAIGDPGDHSF